MLFLLLIGKEAIIKGIIKGILKPKTWNEVEIEL